MSQKNNYAFIDNQNLHRSIKDLGWNLDFRRFRIYLKEKYAVEKAFVFIGYVEGNTTLYTALQDAGFICVFKPTIKHIAGRIKGNCDTELVLWVMIEYLNYNKAIIVSGDGDFFCVVNYLIQKNKLEVLLIPNRLKFSSLFKIKIFSDCLRFMNDLREKLERCKK